MKFKDYLKEEKYGTASILKKVKNAIKGKFVEGDKGQVGVDYKVAKGWLPAYGKVNIGKSAGMSVKEREKHVLSRIKQSLDAKGEEITEFSISYGTGKNFDGKKINIKV